MIPIRDINHTRRTPIVTWALISKLLPTGILTSSATFRQVFVTMRERGHVAP